MRPLLRIFCLGLALTQLSGLEAQRPGGAWAQEAFGLFPQGAAPAPPLNELEFADPPFMQWDRVYGGSGDDFAVAARRQGNGEIIFIGRSNSTLDGDSQFLVFKTDPMGILRWQRLFGGPEEDFGTSVAIVDDDTIFAAGYSFLLGGPKGRVVKIDADGNSLWDDGRLYGFNGGETFILQILPIQDRLMLIGETKRDISSVPLHSDVYLNKITIDGFANWGQGKVIGVDTANESGRAAIALPDGDIVVTGFQQGLSAFDLTAVLLLKVSTASGLPTSMRTFDQTPLDFGADVKSLEDGDFAIAGSILIRTDPDGAPRWIMPAGSSNSFRGLSVIERNENLIVVGKTMLYVTDRDGNKGWELSFQGSQLLGTPDGFIVVGSTDEFGFGGSDARVTKFAFPPLISFQSASGSGEESVLGEIGVVRSWDTDTTVTVEVAVAGGSASRGEDYRFETTTIKFSPGDVSKVFSPEIVDDEISEENETIDFVLLNPSPNARLYGGVLHTYTILDDDPNTPPVVTDPFVAPSFPAVNTPLRATYRFSDADGDPEVSREIRWFKEGVHQPDLDDRAIVNPPISEGNWSFTIRSFDGMDFSVRVASPEVQVQGFNAVRLWKSYH